MWWGVVWVLGLGGGCISEVVQPLGETTLSVARAGDVATLQWTAQPGFYYTVMYSDRGGGGTMRWEPLADAVNLRVQGADERVVVQDRVEAGRQRRYHLLQGMAPLRKSARSLR